MPQAVSRRPLTAEARLLARLSPCEICGVQSSTGTSFSTCYSVFPCQCHSTIAFHTHTSPAGIVPLVTTVQIHRLSLST
jgi:hypothetical protein